MSDMSDELAKLRRQPKDYLAAEIYVLRERMRLVQRQAEAGLKRAERDGTIALICELTSIATPCDLLPENQSTANTEGKL